MIPNYKNDSWLRGQVEKGKSIKEMAAACSVGEDTIDDRLRKSKLSSQSPMPEELADKDILQWCGQNRRRIPPDVSRATAPSGSATVLILGAGGFVGINLSSYLKHNAAYRVINMRRAECDAMDRGAIQRHLDHIRPDVVVNLAAFVGGIGLNKDNPADMIYRNTIMSANVIDACFTAGVRKLVFLGSVCSYPHTPMHIPFVEDDMWYGRPEPTNEPYGIAKKTAGMMLDAYRRQFNFSSAYLIPTNMYGPHDDFSLQGSHVIPAMIRKFVAAKAVGADVTHWGDGTASRDFLFVDDCCEAIKLAIEKIDDPTPINLGSGYECTMSELSIRIAAATGFQGKTSWDRSKPNGQPRRCLDTSKASRVLNFRTGTDLQTGIDVTVRWYLENITQ